MKPELKVGLTVSFALALLGFVLWWAKDVQVGSKQFNVRFENVSGLQAGDPVMISGLRVGKVDNITLRDGHVNVLISIAPDITLYRNATAYIAMLELMTGKKLNSHKAVKMQANLPKVKPFVGFFCLIFPNLLAARVALLIHSRF
ncbi:MAG: hypothetical protein CMR00_08875 [[Chlorobium] sp. 445]|nr:MAG: hypothetical protein CMR00_08875 [[Chlorobium] sp. 445]